MRVLEEKRKTETEEFIFKNKDFYNVHLEEVRKIKDQYENEIKQLEGKVEGEV